MQVYFLLPHLDGVERRHATIYPTTSVNSRIAQNLILDENASPVVKSSYCCHDCLFSNYLSLSSPSSQEQRVIYEDGRMGHAYLGLSYLSDLLEQPERQATLLQNVQPAQDLPLVS